MKNARVLVIGGSAGIGHAVAHAAWRLGARVTIASSDAARSAKAAESIGSEVATVTIDVGDEHAVADWFARSDGLDHIVYTAGDWRGLGSGPLADLDLAAAADIFRIRFWGALRIAKHAAPKLSPGGSLTFTDGTRAHQPRRGAYVASAMTGAIEHLTRALAVELAPIRVNAVCPGLIRTGAWDRIPSDRRDATFAAMSEHYLIPRVGEPDEVAEAYLYLMKGRYTTGQVLQVEGGSALARP